MKEGLQTSSKVVTNALGKLIRTREWVDNWSSSPREIGKPKPMRIV